MSARRVVVGLLVGAFGIAGAIGGGGGVEASSDELVTLTVGLQQDLDSPNPTAGYLVSAYELWNLQYATLTDKAADDFATIPGLAESWVASDSGLTYTYTLRPGLLWSDGTPLTAGDVAWTINTSRDQGWINHSSVTQNLTATAVNDVTVKIESSVPDPKLPVMDVFILPQHIWEAKAADDITTYDALDGVGSGPFTLKEWKPGQEWTMVANPNFWKGAPAIDQIVFRIYTEGSAMVAALQNGEIDAAHDVPAELFDSLSGDPDIETVVGGQGGFTELAMNGMAGGIGDGHPALLDLDVRHAIAHAIDRPALFDRVVLGQGELVDTLGVSPDPVWTPVIPDDQRLDFDPALANSMLDDGGYLDTDGDGVREMPGGGQPLKFRYAELSDSEQAGPIRELVTGWLGEIGIATEVSVYDQSQLTDVIARGEYDLFVWGWTPFVDPDPMLSYFTCDQVTTDPANPLYNDANWCSEEYDALYAQQNQELDRDKRVELVHQMITLFYTDSTYVVLYHDADTQAYRTDRFEGWLRQPTDTGPVLFSNSSPTYFNLTPIGEAPVETTTPPDGTTAAESVPPDTSTLSTTGGSGDGDDGGSSSGLVIALVVGGLAVVGGGAALAARSRSRRGDRE